MTSFWAEDCLKCPAFRKGGNGNGSTLMWPREITTVQNRRRRHLNNAESLKLLSCTYPFPQRTLLGSSRRYGNMTGCTTSSRSPSALKIRLLRTVSAGSSQKRYQLPCPPYCSLESFPTSHLTRVF